MQSTTPPPCSTCWPIEPLAGIERLTVTTADGVALACWDFGGTGTPLLMLHGIGLHGRCWAPVARLVGAGFRPLALDLRGHGNSQPSPTGDYRWDIFARDALAVVDQLALPVVDLLEPPLPDALPGRLGDVLPVEVLGMNADDEDLLVVRERRPK